MIFFSNELLLYGRKVCVYLPSCCFRCVIIKSLNKWLCIYITKYHRTFCLRSVSIKHQSSSRHQLPTHSRRSKDESLYACGFVSRRDQDDWELYAGGWEDEGWACDGRPKMNSLYHANSTQIPKWWHAEQDDMDGHVPAKTLWSQDCYFEFWGYFLMLRRSGIARIWKETFGMAPKGHF